ncbi:MAG: ABC transporter ATP-binding protein [Desulfocapsaceae bacterium]
MQFSSNGPFSLSLAPGCCAGLDGISGVGKTRLLRALADIDRSEGTVTLNGRERQHYTPPEWRRLVSMIPAESRWWQRVVSDHLPPEYRQEEAEDLVRACGFEPDILGWDVTRLSTGEKQRLSLVRALIRAPRVLLLDEVGSGLDQDNALLLETLVKSYLDDTGAAALWVSHNSEQLGRVATLTMTMRADGLQVNELNYQRNPQGSST